MKLETHAKIGIWVGIVSIIIGMSFFTLHESQSLKYDYGRLFVDENEMYEKLTTTGTMSVFIEKYPYFYEDFNIWRDGSASLDVFAYNNQTGNRLELGIRYDQNDDRFIETIRCEVSRGFGQMDLNRRASFASAENSILIDMLMKGYTRGQFVEDFIKHTNCLEQQPIQEPEPLDPVPICGEGTVFIDGVCLVVDFDLDSSRKWLAAGDKYETGNIQLD